MVGCKRCNWVKAVGRRYAVQTDFLVMEHPRLKAPMVIAKECGWSPSGAQLLSALELLQEVCVLVYGEGYYVDVWSWRRGSHWYAVGRKVKMTELPPAISRLVAGKECTEYASNFTECCR